jgi:hypothetical protein
MEEAEEEGDDSAGPLDPRMAPSYDNFGFGDDVKIT